ncbi:sulfate/tungstate ABC transporter periplasmic substrate-binding protein [Roseivivax marinus]|uniref:Sulfate/tungstate ABC transporter periplasmic substrate-binding protein n=1 Tax=Roseivivax marinus TaxID=1379903 RepID=W4HEJ1_9RHOB|nr:substrate-binding domain-containing protein [Roseivivax marinus]ETW10823.1 sulfate/tungstate ABC transporter periplasmic substrate-binding protein [Roseivivax marinus]
MLKRTIFTSVAALLLTGTAYAQDQSIVVQSTTSTANSGLYDHLLPMFEEQSGIQVNVVAVGTGQAITNAENCDGDLLLVHAKPAEEAFVEAGYGTERTDLMYNDFVIVGPSEDPAGVSGMSDAQDALSQIAESGATFASRGDDSGTHKKELSLWADTDADPTSGSGDWYRETGSGMGATLNAGIGMGAYVMTDRATWISFENKQDYEILVEGDEDLFNQYGVIPVSPEHCPSVNINAAQAFADWLLSADGQEAIGAYEVEGQQLFFPNAPES